MDLENSFVVPADVVTAWRTLLDVEAVASCMPGVSVSCVDGSDFAGAVKVKLGPVTLTYQGEGRFVSADPETHSAVVEAAGRESRGSDAASATVSLRLVAEESQRTRVDVRATVAVTGKAAQFGQGVLADAAKRLIDQFAGNLGHVLTAGTAHGAA
jgi:uncharacterized protein